MSERPSLDVVGYLEGTTKSSSWVDFLRHYERHLAPFRDQEIQLLEIGVMDGASLAIWKYFFPNATIIGVDINPRCRQYEGDRVIIEIGSQDDPEFLATLCRKYTPTIIIDDGSHMAHHVVFTFEHLFPFLLPGGLYVIEDMFFHVGPLADRYLGPATITPPEYVLQLARMLVREGIEPANDHGNMAAFRKTIDEIAVIPNGAAFIRKKAPSDAESVIAEAEAYAATTGKAEHWSRVADLIQRRKGDLSRAEAAARNAIALAPDYGHAHFALSQIQSTANDVDGALQSALIAAESGPASVHIWHHVGQLHARRNDYPAASQAFRRGLEANSHHSPSYDSLSKSLEQEGKLDEASAVLRMGLATAPTPAWSATFNARLAALARKKP